MFPVTRNIYKGRLKSVCTPGLNCYSCPAATGACPLGAIYSLFNRVSVFRMVHDPDKCVLCKECYRQCPMGVRFYEGANQVDCIRCMKCYQEACQYGAISYEITGISQPSVGAEHREKKVSAD
jgi:ferredoxin-type protein NapH